MKTVFCFFFFLQKEVYFQKTKTTCKKRKVASQKEMCRFLNFYSFVSLVSEFFFILFFFHIAIGDKNNFFW